MDRHTSHVTGYNEEVWSECLRHPRKTEAIDPETLRRKEGRKAEPTVKGEAEKELEKTVGELRGLLDI